MVERFKLIPEVHVFLVRNSQVLLLKRFNTGCEDGKYSVLAGHMDGNEEVKAAGIREAREEAGITICAEDMAVVGVIHRRHFDERISFFLSAGKWSGEVVNVEPDKCDDLSWFDFDNLPPNMIPYVRRALQNYREGTWFDSFGWE